MAESKCLAKELALEGSLIFHDDSITLHHANYHKDSWKLFFEHVNIKGKHVIETSGSKIKIKTVDPNELMELHKATSEDPHHIVDY